MKKIILICSAFGMFSFSIAQCWGPDPWVDCDDSDPTFCEGDAGWTFSTGNNTWTANETYTDLNNNGVWDSEGVLQPCEAEFQIASIAKDGDTYTIEIEYKATEAIGGYQFSLRSDNDVTPGVDNDNALDVTGNVGGDLTDSGMTVSGTSTILAFSFTGATIPASAEWDDFLTLTLNDNGNYTAGEQVFITAINNPTGGANGQGDSGLVVSNSYGGKLLSQFWDATWLVGDESITLDNDMINPYSYSLKNNYPNPFNPTTTIEYSIAEISDVNISVYDASGRFVKNLVSSQHVPGDDYQISWNGTNESGTNVAAGMYFYKINAGSFVETKKMLLIK